jgi:hypothetical protein
LGGKILSPRYTRILLETRLMRIGLDLKKLRQLQRSAEKSLKPGKILAKNKN